MASNAIATIARMMETLPEALQNQIVEHLREYIAELEDELRWEVSFNKTQEQLVAAARQAKQEIADGKAEPMDLDRLFHRRHCLHFGQPIECLIQNTKSVM